MMRRAVAAKEVDRRMMTSSGHMSTTSYKEEVVQDANENFKSLARTRVAAVLLAVAMTASLVLDLPTLAQSPNNAERLFSAVVGQHNAVPQNYPPPTVRLGSNDRVLLIHVGKSGGSTLRCILEKSQRETKLHENRH